jgi:DNA-binding transcriptional LysR family regulator
MGTIDLVALEIFRTVAEQGGVGRAATKLNRVPSNVTTRVKKLEQSLGVPLFLRQGRGIVLSPEGRVLLSYAERLLQLSAEAEAAVRTGTAQGTLRLGALESIAATRLPPILSRFHAVHPGTRIDLVTGTTTALVGRVRTREIDGALVAQPFDGRELNARVVFTEELVLIASKGAARIRRPRDIGTRTIIAFATGCAYRQRLEHWLGRGVVPERVLEFGSYHAIVACVAAGSGIAVAPRSVVRALHAEQEVSVHPLPAVIARAAICLVERPDHQSTAFDLFRQELARTHVVPSE